MSVTCPSLNVHPPHIDQQRHLQVGDPAGALTAVALGVGGRRRRPRELVGGDAAGVPVGPEDAVGLDVQVHGVDADAGVALEGLLVAPAGHPGVQAADLVVVGDVKNLPAAVQVWKEETAGSRFKRTGEKRREKL